MLDIQIKRASKVVDAFKPRQHAVVIFNIASKVFQNLTRQGHAFFFGGFHKIIHCAGNLVGIVVSRPQVGFFPKSIGAHP